MGDNASWLGCCVGEETVTEAVKLLMPLKSKLVHASGVVVPGLVPSINNMPQDINR